MTISKNRYWGGRYDTIFYVLISNRYIDTDSISKHN